MNEDNSQQAESRSVMDSSLELKFLQNLQWSMVFFCFNQICNSINEDNEFDEDFRCQKEFIKHWKKFAHNNIAKSDLKAINEILNSPKNIFHAALQHPKEPTDSTEMYQQKYNEMLKRVENFFMDAVKGYSSENGEDPF